MFGAFHRLIHYLSGTDLEAERADASERMLNDRDRQIEILKRELLEVRHQLLYADLPRRPYPPAIRGEIVVQQ